MVKKFTVTDYLLLLFALAFIVLIILTPSISAQGAKYGLHVSAIVLMPSLFPFAVPVLFLINTRLLGNTKHRLLYLFFLSLIGGYPIGAKLVAELYGKESIELQTAKRYLPFYVNGGPAFIIIAVGKGILHNAALGYVLLLSHCAASLILVLIFAPGILRKNESGNLPNAKISTLDNFVSSINNSSGTCILISAFVVFFSVVNRYVEYFSDSIPFLKGLLYITEVTYAVSHTKNVYFISFLLGFAGISIWVQVFSVTRKTKPKLITFMAVRILHGIISAAISAVIIRLFRINITVISNNVLINEKTVYSGLNLSISLFIMLLLFLINLTSKKHSGNFIKDML